MVLNAPHARDKLSSSLPGLSVFSSTDCLFQAVGVVSVSPLWVEFSSPTSRVVIFGPLFVDPTVVAKLETIFSGCELFTSGSYGLGTLGVEKIITDWRLVHDPGGVSSFDRGMEEDNHTAGLDLIWRSGSSSYLDPANSSNQVFMGVCVKLMYHFEYACDCFSLVGDRSSVFVMVCNKIKSHYTLRSLDFDMWIPTIANHLTSGSLSYESVMDIISIVLGFEPATIRTCYPVSNIVNWMCVLVVGGLGDTVRQMRETDYLARYGHDSGGAFNQWICARMMTLILDLMSQEDIKGINLAASFLVLLGGDGFPVLNKGDWVTRGYGDDQASSFIKLFL